MLRARARVCAKGEVIVCFRVTFAERGGGKKRGKKKKTFLSLCCMLIYTHAHTHTQFRRLSNPMHSRALEHTESEWWDECGEIQLKREDKSQGDI